jgi:putative SOS response-associated peptidase YedK
MCGRYRRTTQEEALARLYHIPIPKQTDLPISYNIAPGQKVLTIRFNPETQARSLDDFSQGPPTPVALDDKEKSQRLFMTLIMTFGFCSELDMRKLLMMIYLRRGRESNP